MLLIAMQQCYLNVSGSKPHTFSLSQFLQIRSEAWLSWVLCSGHQLEPDLSEAETEKDPLLHSLRLLAEFSSLQSIIEMRNSFPCLVPAGDPSKLVAEGPSLLLEPPSFPCLMKPPPSSWLPTARRDRDPSKMGAVVLGEVTPHSQTPHHMHPGTFAVVFLLKASQDPAVTPGDHSRRRGPWRHSE